MLRSVRFVLLTSVSFGLGAQAVVAQTAGSSGTVAAGDIVVIGEGQTYSSMQTTDAMAKQTSPVSSINKQINKLPGVQVNDGDAFGFDDWSSGVVLRGFQNGNATNHIGATVDGIPVGSSTYAGGGATAGRFVDPANAGPAEVFQGIAGVGIRSRNSLGGTMAFTTDDPLDERRMRFSGSYGSFDAKRIYGRYDSGLILNNTTKFWVSGTMKEATDHIGGSADNTVENVAAKLKTNVLGVDWTAYGSHDDANEANYQDYGSEAEYDKFPKWDGLTADWTGIPFIDQAYRPTWGTLRTNDFVYLKGEKEIFDGLKLDVGGYYHKLKGRGDFAPPYINNVKNDGAGKPNSELVSGNTVIGGPNPSSSSRLYIVNSAGVALSPTAGCTTSLSFPRQGNAQVAQDPACWPAGATPVMSYRHTHYDQERSGVYGDADWTGKLAENVELNIIGGFWYENSDYSEYRDWHKVIDARVGPQYDPKPYWVQYSWDNKETTFKWYTQGTLTVGDVAGTLGVSKFDTESERIVNFDPNPAAKNFKLEGDSEYLLSYGLTYKPGFLSGVELFAGYADNFKPVNFRTLNDILPNPSGKLPVPETSQNIDLGVRYSSDRLRGSIVYFQSEFDNRLIQVGGRTVGPIDYSKVSSGGFINAGGIETQGVEVAAQYLLTENLSLYGAYSYIDATIIGTGDAATDTALSVGAGNKVPGVPENMFVLSADGKWGHYYGGIAGKWVGERFVNNLNTWKADAYTSVDLYVGASGEVLSKDLANVDIQLNVTNVFEEEFLSKIEFNRAFAGPPRAVVLTVTADF